MFTFDENLLAEAAEKGWLSLNKFAQLIRVAYPTAMRMHKRGDVVVIPFGGINRVSLDEIIRFLFKGNLKSHAQSNNQPLPPEVLMHLPLYVRAKLAELQEAADTDTQGK